MIGYIFLLTEGHRRKAMKPEKVREMESEGGEVEESRVSE